MSRNGARHSAASGAVMANQGEKCVARVIDDGQVRMMTFQLADVTRPLAPKDAPLRRDSNRTWPPGFLLRSQRDQAQGLKPHKKGHVFVMKVQVLPGKQNDSGGTLWT